MPDEVYITIKVKPELRRAAKVKAAQEGMTVTEFLTKTLEWWTGMEPDPGQPAAVGNEAKAGPRP